MRPTSATTFLRSRGLLIGVVAFSLFVAVSAVRMTYRNFRIAQEIDRVKAEITDLERDRQGLENARTENQDLAVIERAARQVLNLQKEGEHVVVLLPAGDEEELTENAVEEPPQEPSNPVKWWAYFFGQ